jgi:hypothetical protein
MKDSRERKEDDASAMVAMNEFLELTSQYSVGLNLLSKWSTIL